MESSADMAAAFDEKNGYSIMRKSIGDEKISECGTFPALPISLYGDPSINFSSVFYSISQPSPFRCRQVHCKSSSNHFNFDRRGPTRFLFFWLRLQVTVWRESSTLGL